KLRVEHHRDLVVREIARPAKGPLLEQHDVEPRGGELAGEDAAGGAGADDREIDRLARGEGGLLRRHRVRRAPPARRTSRKDGYACALPDRSREASSRRGRGCRRRTSCRGTPPP